jgi:hypothetical protein
MRRLFIVCICSAGLAAGLFAQNPTTQPANSPSGPSPAMSASVSPGATEDNDLADQIHRRIDKRFKQKGLHFSIGDEDTGKHTGESSSHGDDIPAMVLPLVVVVFLAVFGAPVLIVAVIMYFGFSKNRMMHRTVRMMVEKGQPVPPALLAPPPPAQRQRSDMRRGVVLVMVGVGLMVFFAAENDWEGGSWALGIIPFLIGVGYLLVWKLEGGNKPKTDNPPPLP